MMKSCRYTGQNFPIETCSDSAKPKSNDITERDIYPKIN